MDTQQDKSVYLIFNQVYKVIQNFASKYRYLIRKNADEPNTIYIKPVNMTSEMIYNMYDKIFKELSSYHYPNSVFTPGKAESKGARYKTIIVNASKDISIKFFTGRIEKRPKILAPGMAFEEYFTSIVNDQITELRTLQQELGTPLIPLHIFNLTLNILDRSTRQYINLDKIVGIKNVGKANKKPDVQIDCRAKPSIKISLKQGNFGMWSSANMYTEALNVLRKNEEKNIIQLNKNTSSITTFGEGVNGVYVTATIDEVKKYCFGESPYQVDYIVINTRLDGIDENYVIHINTDKVYKRTSMQDLYKLQSDVFLLISEDPTKRASGIRPYYGLDVQFVNSALLKNVNKKYVKGVR